jgi:CRP-like cAMP-binding protein
MSAIEQKKSGLKVLQSGQVLFHEGEVATSMYIIQKGQIRLFRPKGKGFIELAVLRAGEVLGEMSFFDPNSKKRSASAAAIATAEVIEISFEALGKTITTLNPWFKTLINTLADRLRRANEKIKEFESNSVGYSSTYKFFQAADVVKMLSMIFLCYRSVGENKDGKWHLSFTKLKSYAIDIFNIQEIKLEEFINLLSEEKLIEIIINPEDETKILITPEPEKFKTFHIVYNTQRSLKDEKKLNITQKGEKFLVKVMEQVDPAKLQDGKHEVDLSLSLKFFKEYNLGIVLDDFMCVKNAKFCSEYNMGENGKITTMLNVDLVNRMFPVIKFMNAINRVNDIKAHAHATGN